MFRLKDLKDGRFQVHAHNGAAFEGTEEAITIAAEELGMHPADVILAKEEMRKLGHDYAEFGIRGRFLYTVADRSKAA